MRLLVYNIAYGTGGPASLPHHLLTLPRYLKTSRGHLEKIINFIRETDADITGLIEVDTGSFRTDFVNQAEKVAGKLKCHCVCSVKYGHGIGKSMPFFRKQANAILTKKAARNVKFHYFPRGFKKLIIEMDLGKTRFFLVHLALQRAIRAMQLDFLRELARGRRPVIIAGDFNTFSGLRELERLQSDLSLVNPNSSGAPTFPSWNPRKQLDFILCSETVRVHDFRTPDIRFSDHLPLIMDFDPVF
jgi:endonuclease/exonuclease/phosphatase family metal-dependent hydrolase